MAPHRPIIFENKDQKYIKAVVYWICVETLGWRTVRQSSNDRFWQLCVWSGTNTILSRDAEQVRVALQQFTNTYWQLTGWHCTTDHPHAATSSRNSSDVTLLDDVLDDCWASVGLRTLPQQIDVVLAGPRHRQIPRRRRNLCEAQRVKVNWFCGPYRYTRKEFKKEVLQSTKNATALYFNLT